MKRRSLTSALVLSVAGAMLPAACGSPDDEGSGPTSQPTEDASVVHDAAWMPDSFVPPAPTPRAPCTQGKCWQAPALSGSCAGSALSEDFSTGKYNVHEYALSLPANEMVDLTATVTGGAWSPALIVNAATGETLYDGEVGASGSVKVSTASTGRTTDTARLGLLADTALDVKVFVTGWNVVDGDFAPPLPTDASYSLSASVDCQTPTPGTLLSPPNFDPAGTKNGFFMLPDSEPPGLYVKKGDACSWGTKTLIDAIYTVATLYKPLYPAYSPLSVRDMNEDPAACGKDHETHADGTHVDIVAGCATNIACADKAPKIALAKLFIDTGVACGIINNDTAVHQTVNAYFAEQTSYAPWHGQFMRSVSGHTEHFHVRVKKPDGTCN